MGDKAYIEQIIQAYNKVVLLEKSSENFDREFLGHANITDPQILILSAKQLNNKEKQTAFRRINEEAAKKLCTLYHIYEFADNFTILEKNSTFATIFNYVQTGILTLEEAWQALLEE